MSKLRVKSSKKSKKIAANTEIKKDIEIKATGKNNKKVFIVIPAYNEERVIGEVIRELKEHNYHNIIVINDCSTDNTHKVLDKHVEKDKITHIKHPINRGQGASLKTGIDHALESGADIIVTFDADGQHRPEDIARLIDVVDRGYDIVLGSRFIKSKNNKSNIPAKKKVLLKGAILFTQLTSGIRLTDVHNGLRALTKNAAEKIEIKQDRMAHASEILDEIKKKNLRYKEVPVTIRYTKYSIEKGQSVFNSVNIAGRMILRKLLK